MLDSVSLIASCHDEDALDPAPGLKPGADVRFLHDSSQDPVPLTGWNSSAIEFAVPRGNGAGRQAISAAHTCLTSLQKTTFDILQEIPGISSGRLPGEILYDQCIMRCLTAFDAQFS